MIYRPVYILKYLLQFGFKMRLEVLHFDCNYEFMQFKKICVINIITWTLFSRLMWGFVFDFLSDLMDYCPGNHKLGKKIRSRSSGFMMNCVCVFSFSRLPYFAMKMYPYKEKLPCQWEKSLMGCPLACGGPKLKSNRLLLIS